MMDVGFSLQYSVADSAMLHFAVVQLNRIEWMLLQLMTKLVDSTVPDPCVSGPVDKTMFVKVGVS